MPKRIIWYECAVVTFVSFGARQGDLNYPVFEGTWGCCPCCNCCCCCCLPRQVWQSCVPSTFHLMHGYTQSFTSLLSLSSHCRPRDSLGPATDPRILPAACNRAESALLTFSAKLRRPMARHESNACSGTCLHASTEFKIFNVHSVSSTLCVLLSCRAGWTFSITTYVIMFGLPGLAYAYALPKVKWPFSSSFWQSSDKVYMLVSDLRCFCLFLLLFLLFVFL